MEENIILYKFLESIKNSFLFIFEENLKENDIIIAVHNIQNKRLEIIFSDDLSYENLNNYLINSNVLLIKKNKEFKVNLGNINVPIFYYEDTLKSFGVKDDKLNELDVLIEKTIKEDNNKNLNIFDEKNVLNTLGIRIKKIRVSSNYTQEEFSNLLGISPNYLSDVERGKKSLSIEKILYLCKTLKLDLNELFLNIEIKESDGIVLGTSKDKKIILSDNDRKLHTVLMGPIGCGKSRLLKKYIEEDISKGSSVFVLEPKGDLIESIRNKENYIYLDMLEDDYYINLLKYEVSFISKVLIDTFEVDSYNDNISICNLINKTLEQVKNFNTYDINIFVFTLNQNISNYLTFNKCEDLMLFFNNVKKFFSNDYIKKIFTINELKMEFEIKEVLKENIPILISTRQGYTRELAKQLGNLFLSYYKNAITESGITDNFKALYIDEIQNYNYIINDFILYARRFNVGITITAQNLELINSNIFANIRNFIVSTNGLGGLSHRDKVYLSSKLNFDISNNFPGYFYHIIKDLSVTENGYFEFRENN